MHRLRVRREDLPRDPGAEAAIGAPRHAPSGSILNPARSTAASCRGWDDIRRPPRSTAVESCPGGGPARRYATGRARACAADRPAVTHASPRRGREPARRRYRRRGRSGPYRRCDRGTARPRPGHRPEASLARAGAPAAARRVTDRRRRPRCCAQQGEVPPGAGAEVEHAAARAGRDPVPPLREATHSYSEQMIS